MYRKLIIATMLLVPISSMAEQSRQSTEPQYFQNRSQGMSAVSREIDALKQLIKVVQTLPEEPGRNRIAFRRLLTDLDIVQKGVLQTINLPTTAPVQGQANYPALFSDYLE